MARPVRGWREDESGPCAETTVATKAIKATALHWIRIVLIESKPRG